MFSFGAKEIGRLLFSAESLDFVHPDIKYRVPCIRSALFVTNAYRTQFVEIREDCGKNEPKFIATLASTTAASGRRGLYI